LSDFSPRYCYPTNSTFVLKSLCILLCVGFLAGCQALTASTAVLGGSIACSSNEKDQSFPEQGTTRTVGASFSAEVDGVTHHFSESSVCEYQGALCGGGTWFEVWYGDQSLPSIDIPVAAGDTAIYDNHMQCVHMNDFVTACKQGDCDPKDFFGLLIEFSKENTEIRRAKIDSGELKSREGDYIFPGREYVPYNQLSEHGIFIENLEVQLSEEVMSKCTAAPGPKTDC